MAKQSFLYFIATSKALSIESGGAFLRWDWGTVGTWRTFKKPVAVKNSKVKYNKTAKNTPGAIKKHYTHAEAGVTKYGTYIPATAQKTVDGVLETVDVKFDTRKYTIYKRTATLKKSGKMSKLAYDEYQYRLIYKDKKVVDKSYSDYADGYNFVYFANEYWKNGVRYTRNGHIPHPVEFNVTYSDVRRNIDTSAANNGDGRDNKGTYVLSNVRNNVVTLNLKWAGLSANEGKDLLDTLNPSLSSTNKKQNYLLVQYRDPATLLVRNKTFFASERNVERYPNGVFKEISVTLTEV